MTPRISVVVPARDAETTIVAALESTLRDLPDDATVLVRSDGSRDDTVGVLRAMRDRRVTVVEGATSLGVAASLNELLAMVDTPLVARMDADDLTLPGRFAAQMRNIDAGHDLVFTTTVAWRPDRPLVARLRPPRPLAISPAGAPWLLLLENGFGHPTLLARTDVVRGLGGYRPVPSEDFDLWIRAALDGRALSRTARPGVLYRTHAGQVTADPAYRAARAEDETCITALEALAARQLGDVPAFLRWRKAGMPLDAVPSTVDDELGRIVRAARHLPLQDAIAVATRARQHRRRARRGTVPEASLPVDAVAS